MALSRVAAATTTTLAETATAAAPVDNVVFASMPTYSLEQVKAKKKEGWVVVDGEVYNVMPFVDDHPGGRDYILDNAGVDISYLFKSDKVHAHSDKAWEYLEKHHIGHLVGWEGERHARSSRPPPDYHVPVDLRKPAVPQVLKSGKDYQYWVHHASAPNGFRIFQSSFCEALSHYPWWYIFFMWIPIIGWCVYQSLQHGLTAPMAVGAFLFGMLIWTFLEYLLHRFVFHMDTSTGGWNFIHFMAHGIHHLCPTDASRLTFPPVFSVFVGSFFYALVVGGIGPGFAEGLFAGGAFTYMMYDAMHYTFHHGESVWMPAYVRWMKSRHMDHHYKNENKNFGVTCPLWDYVFGTC